MKRLFLLIVISVHLVSISAQYFCYTSSDYENRLARRNSPSRLYEGPYSMRVYFHIIKKTDGTGPNSFSVDNISSCMQVLNQDFNPHNIYFNNVGMDYIYNTDFYNMESTDSPLYDSLINTNAQTYAIDIYLLPYSMPNASGKANGVPGRALAIGGVMNNFDLASSHVLSHEMGHCLGLFHTFHGGTSEPSSYNDHSCPELVNGSNCSNCGDYVCDTPADPFPHFDITGCTWNNTSFKDANNQLYNPDTRQIMAYVPVDCMDHLSYGQGSRMREHIATEQILQDRQGSSLLPIVYVQNKQFSGTENVRAANSVIAGRNVTSGTIGDVNILSGANVTFEAGENILLKPGFSVSLGAAFTAAINHSMTRRNSYTNNITDNKYLPLLENTYWTTISYYFEPPTMASIYANIGDTLIGEKKHNIIKQYVINVNDATVNPDLNPSVTTFYMYEDIESKRVYQYDESYKRDVLMYDFSVQIGDKMPIDSIRRMTTDTLFVLKDISDIENSGYTRKQFTFVHGTSDSIVWVEGIGNYTNFTIPYATKRPEMSRILCVQKDDNTVYDTGIFKGKTCEDIEDIFNNYNAISETKYIHPSSVTKILRNSQIYILRGDKTYTLQGIEIKE